MYIVLKKVRRSQTCHTGADYSHFLLCFAPCNRHLDGALTGLDSPGVRQGQACRFCGTKSCMQACVAGLNEASKTLAAGKARILCGNVVQLAGAREFHALARSVPSATGYGRYLSR